MCVSVALLPVLGAVVDVRCLSRGQTDGEYADVGHWHPCHQRTALHHHHPDAQTNLIHHVNISLTDLQQRNTMIVHYSGQISKSNLSRNGFKSLSQISDLKIPTFLTPKPFKVKSQIFHKNKYVTRSTASKAKCLNDLCILFYVCKQAVDLMRCTSFSNQISNQIAIFWVKSL